jgi:6-phosphogluconolactonase/glucosamine-6-phosphate isomerase/deaminase
MGLAQNDFKIPEDTLDELNGSTERAMSDYFERNPNEDPLDSMSVTFKFIFGCRRVLDLHVAGKRISVDLN